MEIHHVLYINLDSRPDRQAHVEQQLSQLGWLEKAQRFPGVVVKNPAVGCSMSHLKCLELAKSNHWDHVLIVEDDIEFLDPAFFQSQLQLFLTTCAQWDVLLVAGNNMLPYTPFHTTAIQVMNCQTTTGYLVRRHYYDTLIQNIRGGIAKFLQFPDKKWQYAIDKHWIQLQRNDTWYLIVPLTVVQRRDYSDVEKKNTDYRKYMLDYNKVVVEKSDMS